MFRTDLAAARQSPALARRIVATPVTEISPGKVLQAMQEMADEVGVQVVPAAMHAAMNLSMDCDGGQPGASISLLAAAVARAQWTNTKIVEPDTLFSVPRSEWPEP